MALNDRSPATLHQSVDGRPERAYPLGRCQGDCDDDDECAEGLLCLQRRGGEAVPGCTGGEEEILGFDYCYDPTTFSPTPAPTITQVYTMDFLGRFQKLKEDGCTFPNPELVAGCTNGRISLVRVSDPAITCSTPIQSEDGSSSTLNCSVSCSGDGCGASFTVPSNRDVANLTVYGEVYFQCQTEELTSKTAGWFELSAREGGSCDSTVDVGVGSVSQTGELGVLCSDPGNYVFRDSFFECNMESKFLNLAGIYTCTSGGQPPCFGDNCTFSIGEVVITGDVFRFSKDCIQTVDASMAPDIPAPNATGSGGETLTALFQLNSGFFYNEDICVGRMSGLRITCTNGNITLVDNNTNMTCTEVSESLVQCMESTRHAPPPRNEYINEMHYVSSLLSAPSKVFQRVAFANNFHFLWPHPNTGMF